MLGFGFNKTKVLAAAERHVQQGKFQNAIAEYQKILNQDSRESTVLNTVGDLYARLNQVEKATECFQQVAEAYAETGFMVRAIAVYRKLARLNPSNVDYLLKLGELYRLQGLHTDARAQYMQATDALLAGGNYQQSGLLLKKILELDPENLAAHFKLADVYVRLSKSNEALDLLFRAADVALRRGSLDEAQQTINRLTSLNPEEPRVVELKGRLALERGDVTQAAKYLESVPGLQTTEAGLQTLTKLYLRTGQVPKAILTSKKLLTDFSHLDALTACCDRLIADHTVDEAIRIYGEFPEQLLPTPGALEKLQACIGKVRDNAEALQTLKTLLEMAGDNTHSAEILELIANACVQGGELARARDTYRMLADLEPQNPVHLHNYNEITAKLGNESNTTSHQEPQPLDDSDADMETIAYSADAGSARAAAEKYAQNYPEELKEEIRTALAEAELFESYHSPAKAIAALERVRPQAPSDIAVNEQLLSLYAQIGRFADARDCCEKLNKAFLEIGEEAKADDYAERAMRYRAKAESVETAQSNAAQPEPEPAPAAAASSAPEAGSSSTPVVRELFGRVLQPSVEEIDLSCEWEQLAAETPEAETSDFALQEESSPGLSDQPLTDQLVEEIRFYLSQSLMKEAQFAILKLSENEPNHPDLTDFCCQLADLEGSSQRSESAPAPEKVDAVSPEIIALAPATAEAESSWQSTELKPVEEIEIPPDVLVATSSGGSLGQQLGGLDDFARDLDSALGDDFAFSPAEAVQRPAPMPPPLASPSAVASISASAATSISPTLSSPPQVAPAAAATRSSTASVSQVVPEPENSILSDVFAEFKEDVERESTEEDPERHYNLALAFREMGLFEEAIGEFQKVCQAIDQGYPFGSVIQAYTWLADCLVCKGMPEASFRWFQRALETASDEEMRTAIRYEWAQAHEKAGQKAEALRLYVEVYGSNIDYRDVGERIRALK